MPRSLCAAQRGGRHCPNGIIIAARGGLVNVEHAAHPLCQGALAGPKAGAAARHARSGGSCRHALRNGKKRVVPGALFK